MTIKSRYDTGSSTHKDKVSSAVDDDVRADINTSPSDMSSSFW